MRTREIVNEINSLLNQSTYLYAQENRISYVEMMVLYALLNTDAPLTQIELGAYYVISKQSINSAVKNTKQKASSLLFKMKKIKDKSI
uniref:MarR family transcriptional regulator n=1 Tax=Succinivibrio sp. TaxID=2053619 RepID=UPI003FF00559